MTALQQANSSEPIKNALLQWKLTKKLLKRLTQKTRDLTPAEHRNAEVKLPNILGRWLMTMQYNCEKNHALSRYPLFPRQAVSMHKNKAEFARMLREHFVDLTLEDALEIVEELISVITQYFARNQVVSTCVQVEPQFTEDTNNGRLSVGEFKTPFCSRVKFLVHRFGLANTALACLRYDPLQLFLGGECSASITFMNALHDIGMATFEGFASPLNCRLLGREGVKFCSLFEDTDAAFGSLGNFFRVDLTDNPGGWILSPPFVEPVLDATADRVLRTLDDTEPCRFWFYITFPHWSDNTGWQALDQSPMKVARIDCKEGSFISQDCYGGFLRPSYAICVFMLGQLPDSVNLIALREQLCCTDEESIRKDWRDACDCGMADYGQF